MSVKNNKKKEANKNAAALNTPSIVKSEAIQFPLIHSTVLNKAVTENSRKFTRYSFDDNGGSYLGL
jgi:hypothetical protein